MLSVFSPVPFCRPNKKETNKSCDDFFVSLLVTYHSAGFHGKIVKK